ncbi:hypothetical protein GSI_14592 [Ganoderma sinense ZZ0214-1]|uniref:Uncharacterized protein n=1 Tax=Ganoderma sinense ZZ0214-1 TaxID=1077348 RepID=A0A2G8RP45_9APHY|nr:hypothetical protein GSI_14592 [Ganoderma sinense ZZ0214-1]
MAPVASSSSASASRSRPRKDLFKPKFPLDPFSGHSATALGEPWFLKTDALLNATAFHRRNVIFVIGAPSLTELGPLLQSHQLAKSLVILATHNPPDIPGIVYPTVRILRLTVPLALEDSGAVRFVNVLEWAERVARTWRKLGDAGVVELSEESDINGSGDLKPPSVFRFSSQSTPPSPRSSATYLTTGEASAPPSRTTSRPPSIVSMLLLNKGSTSLPPPDPSQRPFDALINFLPEKISDKALLKNTILVTTISRPFLKASYGRATSSVRTRATSSSSPPCSPRSARPRSIFGAFSRSSSSLSVYIPSTPQNLSKDSLPLSPASASVYAPPGKALLVHLLPSPRPKELPGARRRLVDSIETFLLSFSFHSAPGMQTQTPPSSASRTSTYSPGTAVRPISGVWAEPDSDHARAYLMQTSTFCDSVGVASELTHGPSGSVETGETGEWTVADIVLSGALDADGSATVDPPTGSPMTPTPMVAGVDGPRKRTGRAWIAAAADLVIVPFAAGDDCSPSPSPSSSHTHARAYGQATPSRTARSSSAPLLSAEWAPASSGSEERRLSMFPPEPEIVVQSAAAAFSTASSSASSSDSASTSRSSNHGSTPTPPPMYASASLDSTPASSLGPRTPLLSDDSESEHGGVVVRDADVDAEKDIGKMGVGLAVAVSVQDSRGGTKAVKAAKWKFWRRKAGANATAPEVGTGA